MRIRTDDEVYRVDAVWLGPPKATFPWRARYVAWGVGSVVYLLLLTVLRNLGVGLFWSFAWGMVGTIALTMLITSRISHERPLTAVLTMWVRELNTPREDTTAQGGAVSAAAVRVRAEYPRKRDKQKRRAERARERSRAKRQQAPGTPAGQHEQKQTRQRRPRKKEVSGVRTP
ncbi:hypothetical protein [Actinokineospora bangkokensis]|uniref:Uncharacterized protein n=1 Tax=Actinokineospora bangkokensis TaxID=1193682 RepID=A0A1Q9LDT0_9PSEU|nr:hypothetical protein [Actinokineospora bangkokensis]OLR90190.1 hypothetical protein BJP25_04315 [Actinokineospora bangkokensis]